jgi:hypothetical protein
MRLIARAPALSQSIDVHFTGSTPTFYSMSWIRRFVAGNRCRMLSAII